MYENSVVTQDFITNIDCKNRDELISKFECIRYMPGLILVKDINSQYLSASTTITRTLGFNKVAQVINLKDYDLPCGASEAANQFVFEDKQVLLTKRSITTLNVCCYANDSWKILLGQKLPIIGEDGIVLGIFFQGIDITKVSVLKYYLGLNLNQLDQKIERKRSVSYVLSAEHCPLPLPPRQQECVFLLVRGKTFKEIAYLLRLSERTVEDYIECIKHKLGCHTKGQVIEKAIDSGFLFYIPERFFKG